MTRDSEIPNEKSNKKLCLMKIVMANLHHEKYIFKKHWSITKIRVTVNLRVTRKKKKIIDLRERWNDLFFSARKLPQSCIKVLYSVMGRGGKTSDNWGDGKYQGDFHWDTDRLIHYPDENWGVDWCFWASLYIHQSTVLLIHIRHINDFGWDIHTRATQKNQTTKSQFKSRRVYTHRRISSRHYGLGEKKCSDKIKSLS